jgi:ABC-type sugar transport system permease subunit
MSDPGSAAVGARRQWWAPYLMVAPFVAVFLAFTVYPLLRSLVLATEKSAGPRFTEFVGLGNLAFLMQDSLFWRAVINTVIYMAAFVGIQMPIALALALAVNQQRLRFRSVFRYAFFCPHLVGTVFVAVIFLRILSRDGLVNVGIGEVASWFNLTWTGIDWLKTEYVALGAILVAALWLSVGYSMIYLLAALQTVDKELLEAARVDGANAWQRLRHVTLPAIMPTLVFLTLVSSVGAMQLFELPYLLCGGGGPRNSTLSIVGYLFDQGFVTGNLGYASAVGWALVALCAGLSLLQVRRSGFHRA